MITWRFEGQNCLQYEEDNVRFINGFLYPCINGGGEVCRHLKIVKPGKVGCVFDDRRP